MHVIDEVKDEVGTEVREQALKGPKINIAGSYGFFKRGNLFNKRYLLSIQNNKVKYILVMKRWYIYSGEKNYLRKATDLDQIGKNRHGEIIVMSWLLNTKRNTGQVIKMPGEPPLSGNYFIEVPASNQSAQNQLHSGNCSTWLWNWRYNLLIE